MKAAPQVTVGSYPEVNNSYYRTRVTLQGQEEADLDQAENYLKSVIDQQVGRSLNCLPVLAGNITGVAVACG